MDSIEISVIIPMYNAESTIISTLNSVVKQSKVQFIREVIVINDGSTDNSKRMVENYIKTCPIEITLINQTNHGVSHARNTGMKWASGNWIAFLDSDDSWLTDKIEVQVNEIEKNKKIDFLGTAFTDKKSKIILKKISKISKLNTKQLCIKMLCQTSTILFKRSIYTAIGGFDTNQTHCEDSNYILKISTQFNVYYLPQKTVIYGSGKRGFGVSGLSSNLKKMHEGSIKNIKELRKNNDIDLFFYILLRVFYSIKYVRRRVIVRLSK